MRYAAALSTILVVIALGLPLAAAAPSSESPPLHSTAVITLSPTGQERAHAVAFAPDGRQLAVATTRGLALYDTDTWLETKFIALDAWARSLAFSPDGQTLAAGSYDGTVLLWRVADGAVARTLEGHSSWVRSVAFLPNGQTLLTAGDDNTLRWWRVRDGALLRTVSDGMAGIRVVAVSPDGRLIAAGCGDNQIRLLDAVDGSLVRTLTGHSAWIRALAFSPDGQTLASGAFDATARLWRVSDGAPLHRLEAHVFSVLGVAFSPDGQTLATASVDKTVGLWRVADGTLRRLLAKHENFVFGVAFSPDGRILASGAADNTVRLWDVSAEALPPTTGEAAPPASVDASCVTCHHPRGDLSRPNGVTNPPPVVDVACAACHWEGSLGLNWCIAFPRALGENTLYSTLEDLSAYVGLQRNSAVLSVALAAPGNGEHFYVPNIHTALPVSGRLFTADGAPADLEVHLEIWSGGALAGAATTRADQGGRFYFNTDLRPDGIVLEVPIEERGCVMCHNETLAENPALPPGDVRLVVSAVGADGQVASDERWITVDRSGTAAVTVQAVLEGGAAPLPAGLVVQGQTRLYEWRGRAFSGVTAAGGVAQLQVEALSEAPTRYAFSLPPFVVDGVLYSSLAPAELTLPAGAASAAPVTLVVRAQRGSVTGRLAGAPGLADVPIWAVPLSGAAVMQTRTSQDGAFTFGDLPVDEYLIMADAPTLSSAGLRSDGQRLDLSQTPQAEVLLAASKLDGLALHGAARDSFGRSLPFAWAAVDGASRGAAANPATGEWTLWEAPEQARAVVVSAPGYYSQAQAVSDDEPGAVLDFRLTARPDTRYSAWGGGEVVLPAQTLAEVEGRSIRLERGWLWGESPTVDPVTIQSAGVSITLYGGRFAVENLPGQTAWLYVIAGEAEVAGLDQPGPITWVPAGSMLALNLGGLAPIPMEAGLLAALRPDGPAPVSAVWEPSVAARARDALARMGINTAQIITFVTYSTVLVALVSLPVVGVIWWGRYTRRHWKPSP
jgi:DNA-binding beta-propeller fold protein YncE